VGASFREVCKEVGEALSKLKSKTAPPPTPPPPKKMSLDFLTLICTHKPLVLLHIFCFHATNSAFYKCLPKIIVHRGPDSYVPAYCIGYSLEAMVASFLF
jgi:hypothetical protein